MKWIFEYGEPDQMLTLRPKEAKTVAGVLERSRKKLQKDYERYLDIHESGEATERQQTKLFELEDVLRILDQFIKETNDLRKI